MRSRCSVSPSGKAGPLRIASSARVRGDRAEGGGPCGGALAEQDVDRNTPAHDLGRDGGLGPGAVHADDRDPVLERHVLAAGDDGAVGLHHRREGARHTVPGVGDDDQREFVGLRRGGVQERDDVAVVRIRVGGQRHLPGLGAGPPGEPGVHDVLALQTDDQRDPAGRDVVGVGDVPGVRRWIGQGHTGVDGVKGGRFPRERGDLCQPRAVVGQRTARGLFVEVGQRGRAGALAAVDVGAQRRGDDGDSDEGQYRRERGGGQPVLPTTKPTVPLTRQLGEVARRRRRRRRRGPAGRGAAGSRGRCRTASCQLLQDGDRRGARPGRRAAGPGRGRSGS